MSKTVFGFLWLSLQPNKPSSDSFFAQTLKSRQLVKLFSSNSNKFSLFHKLPHEVKSVKSILFRPLVFSIQSCHANRMQSGSSHHQPVDFHRTNFHFSGSPFLKSNNGHLTPAEGSEYGRWFLLRSHTCVLLFAFGTLYFDSMMKA